VGDPLLDLHLLDRLGGLTAENLDADHQILETDVQAVVAWVDVGAARKPVDRCERRQKDTKGP
jgi:hypothetical protein